MNRNREAFERVKEHLLTQGCKSLAEDGSCMYRGPMYWERRLREVEQDNKHLWENER